MTDTTRVLALSSLITSKNEAIIDSCSPNGKIIFKKDKQNLLIADFAITRSNYFNAKCDYIKYSINSKNYTSPLTKTAASVINNIAWTVLHQKPDDLIYTKPSP